MIIFPKLCQILKEYGAYKHTAPNDTAYTRWNSHSGSGKPYANPPAPANGDPNYHFWATQSCVPAGWLVLLLIKAGDVETNPGPPNTRKTSLDLRYQPQTNTG